jgi:hypothetical protein
MGPRGKCQRRFRSLYIALIVENAALACGLLFHYLGPGAIFSMYIVITLAGVLVLSQEIVFPEEDEAYSDRSRP